MGAHLLFHESTYYISTEPLLPSRYTTDLHRLDNVHTGLVPHFLCQSKAPGLHVGPDPRMAGISLQAEYDSRKPVEMCLAYSTSTRERILVKSYLAKNQLSILIYGLGLRTLVYSNILRCA
jgi:hypothetical protein